jgi:RNA polymerase sigma-70 factor, ECF subfamily
VGIDQDDFDRRTGPYRRELLAHCYQLLGSVHDAEDLVQETLLRAWRARDSYDERKASLRTWLHRIAVNACLTALESRARRPLPSGFTGPSDDPDGPMRPGEVAWLQPFPTGADRQDPADVLAARGALRLALIAAMQYLPARQRAILVLREALELPAAEVAAELGTTVAAVNSGLQRARARLGAVAVAEGALTEPAAADRRAVLDRYVAAFEAADVAALSALLAEDVVLEMPPVLNWYRGPAHYGRFMARVFAMRDRGWRVLPIEANGQPALAAYARGADGFAAHSIQVLDVAGGAVRHNVVFYDQALFAAFGLPPALDR